MSYKNLVEKVVSEDAVAGVTAEDGETTIDYLPDGFVSAKDWFKRKSQLKKKWKLEVLDSKQGHYDLKLEEYTIRIPKKCYQEFNEKVINVIDKKELDLTCLLEEAQNEEVNQLLVEIEAQIKGKLLTQKAISQTSIIRNYWLSVFPGHVEVALHSNTLIDLNNYNTSVIVLLKNIKEKYGSDVGRLELLLGALEEGHGLNQYEPFLNKQNILGCKVKSNYLGVPLTLELNVDMDLIPHQSIEVQSENAEDIVSELSRVSGVKVNKHRVYPRGWMFTPNVFSELKKEIKDLEE